MRKLCFAKVKSHDGSEYGMGWNSGEHSEDAGGDAVLENIEHVFNGGKTHAYHHSIYDTVEGFIKILIVKQDEANEKKLAALFNKSNFEKRIQKLVYNFFFFRQQDCVDGKSNYLRDDGAERAIEKAQQEQAERLALMLILQIKKQTDGNAGSKR